jgi:hypothetical protein
VPAPAAAPAPEGCRIPVSAVSGASIVQATGDSLQRKRWQPEGGVIQLTIKSFAAIPATASFFVCYRWKTTPENTEQYKSTRPDRLDRNNDGTSWTVTTTIPKDVEMPKGATANTSLPLVYLMDIRIIAVDGKALAADVTTTIGITYLVPAIIFALATITLVLVVLIVIANRRLKHPGINQASPFLRIISTPSGYASLSQLQIVLWTLVVAASAVYVMALSGDLIEVTNGTLVLLGIAGVAAIGAAAHNTSQQSAAEAAAAAANQAANQATIASAMATAAAASAPASPVAQAQQTVAANTATQTSSVAASAQARADAFQNPPANQIPQWSDLIVNETRQINGTVIREIDVARFQMLLFTLITAAFVLMNVVTTYVIPEIPTGFLTLMGISNGVYLGAKVAQRS